MVASDPQHSHKSWVQVSATPGLRAWREADRWHSLVQPVQLFVKLRVQRETLSFKKQGREQLKRQLTSTSGFSDI